MKKLIVFTLIVLTAFSVFAGGKKEESGKVMITIAGRDGSYGDSMQMAADAYTAMHPEVTFEVLKLSGGSLYEKTVIDLKSKTGTYDIILIDDPNATQYHKAGWLADLGAMYKEAGETVDPDFIQPALKTGRYPYADNGKLLSLPFAGNVELFAYRTDLFKKYGFEEPVKWSEFLKAVKTIDEKESGVDGVIFRGSKGNPIVTGFLPIFWSYGAKILDESGNVTVNSPEALNALKYYLELSKYAPDGVSMYQSAQVKDAVYTGTAAAAIEVWPGWINQLEDPSVSKVVGKVKVIKHPGEVKPSSPMIGIWLAAIPEASKNKKAAFDFLKFATSYDMQVKMAETTGNPPTREKVYAIESLQKKYPWYPAQLDALKNGVARTRTTAWKQIEDKLGTALQFALIGDMSAEEALAQVEKDIKAIVE